MLIIIKVVYSSLLSFLFNALRHHFYVLNMSFITCIKNCFILLSYICTLLSLLHFFFSFYFISKSISLTTTNGTTEVHKKYTRETPIREKNAKPKIM
jgi:hypothetical protein